MKARKFLERDRTTAGKNTNCSALCALSFPVTDEKYEIRPLNQNPSRAIEAIRKFVYKHLQERTAILEEASFLIYAEVRASSGSLRRKRLAEWKFGDDLELVFKQALQVWETLEIEEDWASVEIDL